MLTRSIALAIALLTGAVGVIPSVAGHRCLWMAERMPPDHACCPERKNEAPPSIAAPCCESIAAVAKQARATNATPDRGIAAPLVVGVLSYSSLTVGPSCRSITVVTAYPRGRPPGDILHAFSTILRV